MACHENGWFVLLHLFYFRHNIFQGKWDFPTRKCTKEMIEELAVGENVIFIRGTETYFVNYTAYGAEFEQLIWNDVLPHSSHRFHVIMSAHTLKSSSGKIKRYSSGIIRFYFYLSRMSRKLFKLWIKPTERGKTYWIVGATTALYFLESFHG